MLDIAVAYQRYKFIGFEFLTWLWFAVERSPDILRNLDADLLSCRIGDRMVLENREKERVEKIAISGDAPDLKEARCALRKGALVIEMELCFKTAKFDWKLSVKGENLSISGLRLPSLPVSESPEQLDEAVLERAYLSETAVHIIDALFARFIRLRLSDAWDATTVPQITEWIGT